MAKQGKKSILLLPAEVIKLSPLVAFPVALRCTKLHYLFSQFQKKNGNYFGFSHKCVQKKNVWQLKKSGFNHCLGNSKGEKKTSSRGHQSLLAPITYVPRRTNYNKQLPLLWHIYKVNWLDSFKPSFIFWMQCVKTPKYLCVGFYNLIFMVRVPFGNERPAGSENKEVQDSIALWLSKERIVFYFCQQK